MQRAVLPIVFLVITCAAGSASGAGNLTIAHCLHGCPKGTAENNEIIVRHLYAVSISPQTRLADWVSYRIVPGSIGVASLLPRDWQDDNLAHYSVNQEELSGEGQRLLQSDQGDQQDSVYRIAEFSVDAGDRGRLIPMTSFAGTSYWQDLNLLSIMTPMKSELRLESWSRLDQAINAEVNSSGELYIVSGPIYRVTGSPPGAVGIARPAAFFKVVANRSGSVAAFVFDQDLPAHAGYCEQQRGVDEVESLSGLDLFPEVDDWPLDSLVSALGC